MTTGVKRREATVDPGRFLNLDAPLHTRLSHESIIHGLTPASAEWADPGDIQTLASALLFASGSLRVESNAVVGGHGPPPDAWVRNVAKRIVG